MNISEEEERKEGGEDKKGKKIILTIYSQQGVKLAVAFSIFAFFLSPRASGWVADKALGFHERGSEKTNEELQRELLN